MSELFDFEIDTVATGILFGEGPVWCDDGTVVCTAVAGGSLHRIWPEERRAEVLASTSGGPNACAPAIDGGFLVTQNGGIDFSLHNLPGFDELPPCVHQTPGIQYAAADGSVVTLADHVADGSVMRAPNDLVTMPNGEVFFTDPGHHPLPPEPSGRVLRMTLDGTVGVVAGGFEYCNGIARDHEGRLLVVEGPGLIVLDPDGSTTWLVDDLEGAGDGLAVDETGNAYVCCPIADRIRIVRPDGSITGSIDLPAHSFPTNCCFGGADGRTLFVTLSVAKTVVSITGLPAPGVPVLPWPFLSGELRLQVHHSVGTVVDPVVPLTDPEGTTTVTPAEIIYHRRVRLLALGDELGNVAQACRQMGISRTRYYEWSAIVAQYGLEGLMPKARRTPQLPNATPTHIIEDLLTLAVVQPTIGCRQYADRLAERGYDISKTTVQKVLVDHGLGRRSQRVARAAAITAATTGLSTEAARDSEPFGFCHYSPAPGCQVAIDSFYIGNLKAVGKVYQLTAIDVATRWAIMLIVLGPVNASHTVRFIDHVIASFRRLGVPVRAVLTDNGPEYIAAGFRAHLATRGLEHVRIPPRSPNHNAVVERFQGTALQECWRPAFHRRRFTSIRQLQTEADAWLTRYHHRRRNHSDYMRGRTPAQILDSYRTRRAS